MSILRDIDRIAHDIIAHNPDLVAGFVALPSSPSPSNRGYAEIWQIGRANDWRVTAGLRLRNPLRKTISVAET